MSGPERLAAVLAGPEVSVGLGCFVIAEHLGHPLTATEGMDLLAGLSAATGVALADAGQRPTLDGVAHHLFTTLGFAGDTHRYYDVANSLLPEVLRRRRGIPITLAVVTIEVAGALGVPATGVGMPGHFLVGDGTHPQRWLDVFDGGRWLDLDAARRRFAAVNGTRARFDPAYLAPVAPAQILARVLANLAGLHRRGGDLRTRLRVLELVAAIDGGSVRTELDLAEACAQVGRTAEAVALLDAVAERLDEPRARAARQRAAGLRARWN